MFYDRFIDLCSKRGVTHIDVRKELKISQSTMASWKSRGLTPNATTLAKIAEYFDVSVNDLLSDSEKTNSANSSGGKVHKISIDLTPDPEWADLYQKLETGTITPDELRRWKEIEATASANMNKAVLAMQTRLKKYMDLLNAAGREEAIKRVEELTEIPKYQRSQDPEDKE